MKRGGDRESDELAAPSRRACPPARSGRYRASATQRRADHADTDSHRRRENRVILAPHDQHRGFVLAEERLEFGIERDVRSIIVE